MKTAGKFLEYRIKFVKDKKTGQITALVPTLGIADYGDNDSEALKNVRDMITFHIECLIEEGKPIPEEKSNSEGVYLRVKCPARAA